MNFEKVKLGDICQIKSGKRLPKGADFAEKVTKYPYIRARDIKAGVINETDLAYLSEEVQKKLQRYIVNAGDIVITIAGTIGDVGYVKERHDGYNLTENAVRLTAFDNRINSKYLLYVLNTKQYWDLMQQIAGGAAQPKLGIYKVESIPLEIPPIETQNRIASILSAYEDLIENNRKQIKLLDEASRRLYKEWFVDLRFPGYGTVKIIDGVPEGWKKVFVTDLLDIKYGRDHKKLEDGNVPVYGSSGIMRYANRKLYSGESVLIPRKGSLNNISYVDGDFWAIDTMFYSIPKMKIIAKYAYLFLSSLDMNSYNIGAAVPSMTVNILARISMLLPTEMVLRNFANAIEPLFERMKRLNKQCRIAAEARDRLLPKLMNGEIEV